MRQSSFRTILISFIGITMSITLGISKETKNGYKAKREKMVKTQLEARDITNKKVLEAMRKVPRHEFIPKRFRLFHDPYGDHPVRIGEDQTISQPYIVALMTQILDPKPKEKILEIGTGSGYQAAILDELKCNVYTIEIIEKLAKNAKKTLKKLGYKDIKVKIGDGYKGWKKYAPFDGIIVTCSPDHIPKPLIEQLKEKGRMVIPVGETFTQWLYLIKKQKGKIKKKAIIPVRFVPMTGEAEEK